MPTVWTSRRKLRRRCVYKYLLLQCKCFVTYVHILCICFLLCSLRRSNVFDWQRPRPVQWSLRWRSNLADIQPASCSATLKFTPRSKPNNPAYLSHNQTIHCLFMGTLLLLGVQIGHHRTLHASRFLWTSDLVYFCKSSYFHTWTYLPIRGLKCREGGHAFWKSWSHQLGWVVHMCESIVSTSAPRHDRLRCRLVFHINSRGLSRPMVSINHKLYIIPFTRKTKFDLLSFSLGLRPG